MSERETPPLEGAIPFNCPNCGRNLGETDGRQLQIDGVVFSAPTGLTCVGCLHPYEWWPTSAGE